MPALSATPIETDENSRCNVQKTAKRSRHTENRYLRWMIGLVSTSRTASVWRFVCVLAKTCRKWVFPVFALMPARLQ
jgi:hypothetical protein